MNTWEIIAALKANKVVPRLAGDQIRLVGETRNLPESLITEIRQKKEELRTFLRVATDQHAFAPIPVIDRQADYPASHAQKRVWVLSQLKGGGAAYNIVRSFYLKGNVIKEHLENAFQLAVQRHDSLRTVFMEQEDGLRQIIVEDLPFSIEFNDLRNSKSIPEILQVESEQAAWWAFDLAKGPLLKVKLYQLADEEYAMLFGVHHIVSDGWSIGVLVQEVMKAYEAFCKAQTPFFEPLRIQYKDYCFWHEESMEGEKGQLAKQFWEKQFATMPDPLNLPADLPRLANRSFEGAVKRFYLDTDLHARLIDFYRDNHITAFNFFRAALTILLSRLTNQFDITIGSPASGRNHLDLENQIGLYVNTLPLRIQLNREEPFLQFLQRTSEHSFKTFEFQDYPFDKIIDNLEIKRDLSRNPLFDVMLVVQDAAIGEGSVNKHQQYGFELSLLQKYFYREGLSAGESMAVKFDLTFNLDYEPDNRFYLEIEYDSKLYKKERIDRMFHAFMHIIEQVIQLPQITVAEIEIATPAEKNTILQQWNRPVHPIEEHHILSLLEPSFIANKEKTALIAGESSLSYGQLNDASDKAANYLQDIISNYSDRFIGLLMGRSAQAVIGILGILKAGAAYVPMDPAYPYSRIEYIIQDARLRIILVDDEGMKAIPANYNGVIIHINDLQHKSAGTGEWMQQDYREQTAYVIYTSGSTGQPKGVEICHRNTIAFLQWAGKEFAATPFDIVYAATSFCFDLSVFECFLPLMLGKSIRLLITAMEITEWMPVDRNILINTVPSVVKSLLEAGVSWNHVTAINIAGEPVPVAFKKEIDFARIEVRNLYGPTEDTTYSTVYRFAEDGHTTVPIGIPVGYTQLYILDPFLKLMPVGVPGEIYLSGQSVAKGYLHRAALTAERFVANPFLPEMVMYKTGDTGRWTEDGMVEFTGRSDDQVKIRGYRIEPGEIQSRLEQHPQVSQAVVTVRSIEGEEALVAYVTGDPALQPVALKEYLALHLPSYMVPAWWMMLEAFPVNANGKVDKKKLPLPLATQQPSAPVEPVTPLQCTLVELWKKVIPATTVGIRDNFFDKGGHSLRATRFRFLIAKELGKKLSLQEVFENPTIEQLAQLLESRAPANATVYTPAPVMDAYPISAAQERLWVLTKFEAASVAYNMPAVYKVTGRLDVKKLQHAFELVIEQYEILRTIFAEKDGLPVQYILQPDEVGFRVEEIELRTMKLEEALSWLKATLQQPFDLEKGPLLRCVLLHTNEIPLLVFNTHHIISDGWSLEILYKKLAAAYRLPGNNSQVLLSPPAIQYKDYAVAQQLQGNSEGMERHRRFWLEQFREEAPVAALPADCNRPDVKTYNGDIFYFQFLPVVEIKCREIAQTANASLFMTLMAAVRIWLKKYSGTQDLVIGTPVSGREHFQLHDQIGFFVNTLPIRLTVNSENNFIEAVKKEREILLAAFDHQVLSFENLLNELQVKRDPSRTPLFDVVLVLENQDEAGSHVNNEFAPELWLERLPVASGIAKYDLVFSFSRQSAGLQLALEYNSDLFLPATVERMAKHLHRVFEQVTASPEMKIKDIRLPDEAEFALLSSKADQTQYRFDPAATIVSLFQQAVTYHADKTALVAGDKHLSYQELDARSGQLAAILIKEYNVTAEELIVLHVDRNEWMLIAILGVLKAGAAYVPVDPDYPIARTGYILEDTNARLIVCDGSATEEIKNSYSDRIFLNITELDHTVETAQAAVNPLHIAYIIYTSGTTGNPKGVLIEHQQVTRLLFHENNLFDFGSGDRWSLFHSYCFDFSVWEMYGALLYGGTVVMVPKHIAQDGRAFFDFLKTERITVLNQTPTAFRSMLQANSGRIDAAVQVRYLIFGGEALMPGILREWHTAIPDCRIINMYGITETTVHVTYKEITEEEITNNSSNIGLSLPTVSCYVLDADLQPVPVGVTGELCVGGAGVARGYLNKPALTAQKFIAHPFRKAARMYRSGDYARILSNGDLEYIGRKDDQVKIRGHRIELAEVEGVMIQLIDIKDAVVLPYRNTAGEDELSGYFIPTNTFVNTSRLRAALGERLPAYMVPAYLIPLENFPLNNNGKLDKKALPLPPDTEAESAYHAPSRNETDQTIVGIWEAILNRKGIGIKDNFFDLGGHSLKAARVVSRIHETMGVKIDLKALFIEPTIEHLSNYVDTIKWMDNRGEVAAGNQDEIIF
jgi:amino acid adenylation domain-containing protein